MDTFSKGNRTQYTQWVCCYSLSYLGTTSGQYCIMLTILARYCCFSDVGEKVQWHIGLGFGISIVSKWYHTSLDLSPNSIIKLQLKLKLRKWNLLLNLLNAFFAMLSCLSFMDLGVCWLVCWEVQWILLEKYVQLAVFFTNCKKKKNNIQYIKGIWNLISVCRVQ